MIGANELRDEWDERERALTTRHLRDLHRVVMHIRSEFAKDLADAGDFWSVTCGMCTAAGVAFGLLVGAVWL